LRPEFRLVGKRLQHPRDRDQAPLDVSILRRRYVEIDDVWIDDGRIDEAQEDEASDCGRLAVGELALDSDRDVVAYLAYLAVE